MNPMSIVSDWMWGVTPSDPNEISPDDLFNVDSMVRKIEG